MKSSFGRDLEKYSRNYSNLNTRPSATNVSSNLHSNRVTKIVTSLKTQQVNKRYTFNGEIHVGDAIKSVPKLYQVASRNQQENDENERTNEYTNEIDVKRSKAQSELTNYVDTRKRARDRTKASSVLSRISSPFDEREEDDDETDEYHDVLQPKADTNEVLIHPSTDCILKNGPLNALNMPSKIDYDDEDIFNLLVNDTYRFIRQKPRRGLIIQCRIHRLKSLFPEYIMYLETCGRMLPLMICTSKLVTTKSYFNIDCFSISSQIDISKLDRRSVGALKSVKSRFLADQFILKNTAKKKPSISKNKVLDVESSETYAEYLRISFDKSMLKVYKPLDIYIQLAVVRDEDDYKNDDGFREYQLNLKNKEPEYDKLKKKYCLDFSNRVLEASTHNIQIVHPNEPKTLLLQMGKIKKNEYICDYTYPFTALQAFGTAISKFVTGNI